MIITLLLEIEIRTIPKRKLGSLVWRKIARIIMMMITSFDHINIVIFVM
jgi:hypothetical protein